MEKDSCDSKNADEAIERGIALIEAYKAHPRVSGAHHAPRNDDLQP